MRRRSFGFGVCAALLLLAGRRAPAQTHDESRLTMGISIGGIGSKPLWTVGNQPIASTYSEPDTFRLTREARSDITISGHVTYYGRPHIGITGEFTYLGLGSHDGCEIIKDNGDPALQAACNSLKGLQGSAATTTIQTGLVVRPFTRLAVQPYLKGMAGLAFTPTSSVDMQAEFAQLSDTAIQFLTIYHDVNWKPIRPSWAVALGFASAPSSGYQLRAEIRESWLALTEITGPSAGQGLPFPTRSVIKGFRSIMVGFDVVLEKRRGRRY